MNVPVFCRVLVLGSLAMAAVSGCSFGHPRADRLLFVVPETLPDGESSSGQISELEEWMARQAGGFTRINGVEGGWMAPSGEVLRESNVLFLLSLPKGTPGSLESELEGRILTDFNQQEAWIQRW